MARTCSASAFAGHLTCTAGPLRATITSHMAGASPRTEWLRGCIALDDKAFILTGRDLDMATGAPVWTLAWPPQMLETSLTGVFAVGDVRSGNLKRVASAVGEGLSTSSTVPWRSFRG